MITFQNFLQLTCWASLNGILWAITLAGIWIPNFIGSNASRSNFCIVANTSEHRQLVNRIPDDDELK